MRSAGRSETGKVRANNEDNYQIFNVGSACIMVLADGIGGMSGGEIASRIAVETISDKINGEASFDSLSDDEIKALLENAYREANVAILKKALSDPELMGMGTTLTVAVIRERKVLIAFPVDQRDARIVAAALVLLEVAVGIARLHHARDDLLRDAPDDLHGLCAGEGLVEVEKAVDRACAV